MPAKHSIKEYDPDGYYHIYNRGVEKRTIFEDDQDYDVFLSNLRFYLSPPPLKGETPKSIPYPSQQLKNHSNKVRLHAFCLMPNHFHLLLQQHDLDAMNFFMRSLSTKYSMYFNKKYDRVGSLFQGVYKAVRVATQEQFLYLTKYIHLNPLKIVRKITEYPYSSLDNYLHHKSPHWLDPEPALSYFSSSNPKLSYHSFVFDQKDTGPIDHLTID